MEASRPSRGPQVVIGITSPASAPPAPSLPAAPEVPSLASIVTKQSARVDRLEMPSEPVLEIMADPVLAGVATRLADREPPVDSLAPAVVSGRPSHHAIEADPFAMALAEETPIPVSTGFDRQDGTEHPSEPSVRAIATPGELSIPPMGDLSVEPVAEQFFSDGELVASRHGNEADEPWETAPDKAHHKALPHVVERRQRFSRYVRWAVSGAAVVCLAALARTAILPHRVPVASAAAAKAAIQFEAVPEAVPEAVVPVAVAPPAPPLESVQAPIATRAAEPGVAVAEPRPPSDKVSDKVEEAKTADKTALQEKVDTRRNLERGKLAEAIESGERSVALDPQDGEAWLLLGAAYQEKGKNADARRCYKACLSEGKRGPLGECRAMLH